MALIHHPVLRVNSQVSDQTLEAWRDRGWVDGLHPDSNPDDDAAVPSVLPVSFDEDVTDDPPLTDDADLPAFLSPDKD